MLLLLIAVLCFSRSTIFDVVEESTRPCHCSKVQKSESVSSAWDVCANTMAIISPFIYFDLLQRRGKAKYTHAHHTHHVPMANQGSVPVLRHERKMLVHTRLSHSHTANRHCSGMTHTHTRTYAHAQKIPCNVPRWYCSPFLQRPRWGPWPIDGILCWDSFCTLKQRTHSANICNVMPHTDLGERILPHGESVPRVEILQMVLEEKNAHIDVKITHNTANEMWRCISKISYVEFHYLDAWHALIRTVLQLFWSLRLSKFFDKTHELNVFRWRVRCVKHSTKSLARAGDHAWGLDAWFEKLSGVITITCSSPSPSESAF